MVCFVLALSSLVFFSSFWLSFILINFFLSLFLFYQLVTHFLLPLVNTIVITTCTLKFYQCSFFAQYKKSLSAFFYYFHTIQKPQRILILFILLFHYVFVIMSFNTTHFPTPEGLRNMVLYSRDSCSLTCLLTFSVLSLLQFQLLLRSFFFGLRILSLGSQQCRFSLSGKCPLSK